MAPLIRLIADTHATIWHLWAPERLSNRALAAIDRAIEQGGRVGFSSITLCEIPYLAEKGRIHSDAYQLFLKAVLLADGPFEEVPLDNRVVSTMQFISRTSVPDLPDRIIAATAKHCGVPLVTRDRRIASAGISVIW